MFYDGQLLGMLQLCLFLISIGGDTIRDHPSTCRLEKHLIIAKQFRDFLLPCCYAIQYVGIIGKEGLERLLNLSD